MLQGVTSSMTLGDLTSGPSRERQRRDDRDPISQETQQEAQANLGDVGGSGGISSPLQSNYESVEDNQEQDGQTAASFEQGPGGEDLSGYKDTALEQKTDVSTSEVLSGEAAAGSGGDATDPGSDTVWDRFKPGGGSSGSDTVSDKTATTTTDGGTAGGSGDSSGGPAGGFASMVPFPVPTPGGGVVGGGMFPGPGGEGGDQEDGSGIMSQLGAVGVAAIGLGVVGVSAAAAYLAEG